MNANIHSHPKKFYNKSIVKFNTNVVSSFGKVDTDRDETRNQNPQNTNNTPSEYQ